MTKPTDILLQGTVGSTAYGLNHEGSDIDTLGMYRAPLYDVLGLQGGRVIDDSWVGHEPDVTLHEVGKYMNLALKCNPTVLELMWLTDYTVRTRDGMWIVANRKHFLSEPAVRGAYGAYALAQAKKLMQRQDHRAPKHARHCMRLLFQGQELLETGHMTLKVTPEVRTYLFELGDLAATDPDKFYKEFEVKKEIFDTTDSVLPQRPNRDRLQDILPHIRLNGPYTKGK